MDKSLDDLIAEQRSKSKPRASKGGEGRSAPAAAAAKGSRPRLQQARPAARRDSRRQDAAVPPPREPRYFQHDDRAGGFGGQQEGPPRGSWKQAQQQHWVEQQQYERPRGRGGRAAAGGSDPIITTADGWEEVAQDEPQYADRRGAGVQRRGGVFDRLTYREGGQYSSRPRERQYGGRFGRARGRATGGRGRGGDEGEPRRRYMDEHDHRGEEDAPPASGGRAARYQPYRVSGGVSKPGRGRGGSMPAGRKWGHDLYDPTQEAAAPADEEEGEGMME